MEHKHCRIGASTALILALALSACGDRFPAGPAERPFEITLGILTLVVSRDVSKAPDSVTCSYYINARAVGGRPLQESSWVGGESVWTFVGGGSRTTTWSQVALFDFFTFNLSAGEIASGRIRDEWLPPYTVTHRFRYRVPSGEEKTATVTLTCE